MPKFILEIGQRSHFPNEYDARRAMRFVRQGGRFHGQESAWFYSKRRMRYYLDLEFKEGKITEEERADFERQLQESGLPETLTGYPCFRTFTDDVGRVYGKLFDDDACTTHRAYSQEKALEQLAYQLSQSERSGITVENKTVLERQIAESGLPTHKNEGDAQVDASIIRFEFVSPTGKESNPNLVGTLKVAGPTSG